MKVLVLGADGQLGVELKLLGEKRSLELLCPLIDKLDITDKGALFDFFRENRPEAVINAAAYTAVDLAESESALAFAVNRDAVGNIALACKEFDSFFLHYSTDYVFNGQFTEPISESASTSPINVYGKSKLAGEELAQSLMDSNLLIVRLSSLHGAYGNNFVHTILRLLQERDELSVVDDQIMSPTWAGWLAEISLDLLAQRTEGLIHASCAGAISWHEFAKKILDIKQSEIKGAVDKQIQAVSSDQFKRPAARPAYSVFDCSKLAAILGREPMSWQDGLAGHLSQIRVADLLTKA